MNHPILKSALPHIIAIAIFILAGIAYFTPVMDGYRISQSDIMMHKGTSKEIQDHRAEYGEEPLWTNNAFGGMPTTQISILYPTNMMQHVSKAFQLWLPSPLNFFFILMIGFYIMTQFLGVKPWLGILGSLAYALSCYFVIIIMVGHNTKVLALGYLPAMIGAVIYTYRSRKIFLGAVLTALFVALELTSNHVQITFYGLFVIAAFAITEFINYYKRKELKDFFVRSGYVTAAFVIGAMCAIGNIWGTMEYGKYTTRGGSEITIQPPGQEVENDKTGGLDRSYITGWSYGVDETWNLLIPNAKGGASAAMLGNDDVMKGDNFSQEERLFLQLAYQRDRFIFSDYWGDQSTTAGPTYIGAVLIFLCILAFIFIDDNIKWALLGATVLTMMLAWGKNFPGLTNFFIDNFPMYSKFRTVSMMLVIAELTIPLLAILALKKITEEKIEFAKPKIKQFLIASSVLLGIVLMLALTKGGSVVRSPENESEYFANYDKISDDFIQRVEQAASQAGSIEALGEETATLYQYSKMMKPVASQVETKITEYRKGIFASDAWRSFFFILVAAGLVYIFLIKKINATILISGIAILVIVDLWSVDKRWVNNSIAKDGSGKEMKDKEGNPVYEMWSKTEQNDKPHTANIADYKILMAEVNANPNIAKTINEKLKAYESKKKESGASSYQLTPQESDFITYGVLNLNSNYRVINTTAALDQDGRSSYFHKSLGGYHGAKLVRIQDVIDFHLGREHREVRGALNGGTLTSVDSALKNFPIINMLNTKYIILNTEGDGEFLDLKNPAMMKSAPIGLVNPHACGNAWFVSDIKWVKDADEEITAIGKFDPSKTAIIDEREKDKLNGLTPTSDPSATVKMEKYKANHLTYTVENSKKNLLVFSEIYYPVGWKVLVDGNETEIVRVNYLLRAIVLEPGKHKIEMIYEPASYFTSKPISLVASLSVIGLVCFAFFREWKQKKSEA